MESIRFLIQFFLKIAVAFFFAAIIWWLVALMFPALSFSSVAAIFHDKNGVAKDWLPAPRNYAGLLKSRTVGTNSTLHVASEPFNGYQSYSGGYAYSQSVYPSYDADGKEIIEKHSEQIVANIPQNQAKTQQPKVVSNPQVDKSLYIRNLSIYESGSIYTGLTFVGEARSEFFNEGKFPVVVVNSQGVIVGVSAALATTKWSTPGWVRFETKIIYTLPKNIPCTMIFEEALTQSELNRQPVRVPMNIKCN
jgi:hypothetical protein